MIRALVALLLLCAPSPAWAGAWLQPQGKAYLRLSGGWLETDQRYDAQGEKVPFDDFGGFRTTAYRDVESIFYAEAGAHPRVTVLTTVILKSLSARQEAVQFNTRGMADVMVGAKIQLWKGLWHVGSLSVESWLPTGYDETEYPALGSGAGEVRLGAHAGGSAGKAWANLDVQYGLRQEPFRDRLVGLLSGGYTLGPRLAARGAVGLTEPLGTAKTGEGPLFDPTAVDTRAVELSATLSWKLGAWALEGEVRGPLSGENTLAATRFALAVATSSSVRLWGEDPPPRWR